MKRLNQWSVRWVPGCVCGCARGSSSRARHSGTIHDLLSGPLWPSLLNLSWLKELASLQWSLKFKSSAPHGKEQRRTFLQWRAKQLFTPLKFIYFFCILPEYDSKLLFISLEFCGTSICSARSREGKWHIKSLSTVLLQHWDTTTELKGATAIVFSSYFKILYFNILYFLFKNFLYKKYK